MEYSPPTKRPDHHIKAIVVGESVVLRKEDDVKFRKVFPSSWKFMIDGYLKGMKASEIYEEGLKRGTPIRLIDLAELVQVVESSKEEPLGLRKALQDLDLSRSLFEYAIFSFRVLREHALLGRSRPAFYFLSLLFWGISVWQLTQPYDFSGFLFESGSYASSFIGLFLGMTVLAFSKGLLLLFMNFLALGSVPEAQISFRGIFFDLSVDSSLVDAYREKMMKLVYYFVSAQAFIISALWWKKWELPGLGENSWVTLAYLMTFVSLNPRSRGETSKIFGLLFPQWKAKRFLSYLENRALFAVFRRGRWVEDESQLLLYAGLCVGWSLSFLFFVGTLVERNLGLLSDQIIALSLKDFTSTGWQDTLALVVIVAIFALMIVFTVYELWRVLVRNLMFLFNRQIKNFSRNRNIRTDKEYDVLKLRVLLGESPLFHGFSPEVITAFLQQGHIQVFKAGQPIILQGNIGTELYMILEGEALVRKQDRAGEAHELAVLSRGAVFGEIALLRNVVRTASVIATSPVRVFVLPKTKFQALFDGLESAKGLERRIALSGVLGDSSVFMNLPKESLQTILSYGEFAEYQAGDFVMEQGDSELNFYIVLRGTVEVLRAGGVRTAQIGPGGFFGEMALFENRPRSASIRCIDSVVVLKLSREGFWKMVDKDLPLAANIQEVSWLRRQAPST